MLWVSYIHGITERSGGGGGVVVYGFSLFPFFFRNSIRIVYIEVYIAVVWALLLTFPSLSFSLVSSLLPQFSVGRSYLA